MENLAKRVKLRREGLGLTQGEVARLSGLKQPDVSKIERGLIQKTTGLLGLSRALRCNPQWLDTGDGEMLGGPQTIDINQPDATNGEAVGRAAMLAAVNILVICLQEMDEESRKEAGHLLQEMAASPAGRWSGRLAELIEKESGPRLWEEVGIYDRVGKYSLSTGNHRQRIDPKSGSAHSQAIRDSNLPTGQDNASTGADREKDQNRGGGGAAGSG